MELNTILAKYPKSEDSLIEILMEYQSQKERKYISEKEVVLIANYLGISESKVCSVASFYTLLSVPHRGRHIIQVCKDLPCYLNDSINVLHSIESKLGIKVNETTYDKKFTLEFTSCIGCCNESPSMRIDDQTYTNLTEEKVKNILSEWGCK